jgi:predicted MFS family arabinose efflux permease
VDGASALTSGYRLAFAAGAGLSVAAVIVAALLLRRAGPASHRPRATETVTHNAQVAAGQRRVPDRCGR